MLPCCIFFPVDGMSHPFLRNEGLFADAWFQRVLSDPGVPTSREAPPDAADRLERLRCLWEGIRAHWVEDVRESRRPVRRVYEGLPAHLCPIERSESNIENEWIRPVLGDILGFSIDQNHTIDLRHDVAALADAPRQRPDLILFRSSAALQAALDLRTTDGVRFCRDALFIVDAKRFDKGIGAEELAKEADIATPPKAARKEPSAAQDIRQVELYLRGYDRPWGVLTNGRSFLLIRRGDTHRCLRFNLVAFLEDLRGRAPTGADLDSFRLFWHLFGLPAAVPGGFLDRLESEGEASTRQVRETLRSHAHLAVERIALGFWQHPSNAIEHAPIDPSRLDCLRERSLVFLYRLLFLQKAEAQGLLPMRKPDGTPSTYANQASTEAIWNLLRQIPTADRSSSETGFRRLKDLFQAVDSGNALYGVPAYNGGLFDPEVHPELDGLSLLDDALHAVLAALKFEDKDRDAPVRPVPYADLDVRDLGDIYEGLLEQRLVPTPELGVPFQLRNQKGERKASGSYFTPDRLVEHLVRSTVEPLLAEAGSDARRILKLRIVDPAMGSGHFLVKVVDVLADWLTLRCDPIDPGAPADDGPREFAYWKAKVAENCIYGVDYNPMSVELAKVGLWLHTAQRDKPLSFLDHHLKVGNALVGAPLDRLNEPSLRLKIGKKGNTWVPRARPEVEVVRSSTSGALSGVRASQQAFGFRLSFGLTRGVLASILGILSRPSDARDQVKAKRREYNALVERLAAHRLLADLWCAHWFIVEPDATGESLCGEVPGRPSLYARLRRACEENDEVVRRATLDGIVAETPFLQELTNLRNTGYGPRPYAFFHWELEFPEVAFDESGDRREGFGFDAVVGNPPWDKIKPARRDFYGPWSPDVANAQATSLDRLIKDLEKRHPDLAEGWSRYERAQTRLAAFLADAGLYTYQVAEVNGHRTGGDPDLFRYFVERSIQALRPGGRMGLVVPHTLWQAEGCTGLRQLLLVRDAVESIHGFENYRKWAFDIDSRFKFTTFVVRRSDPPAGHRFPAGFMLRDPRVLDGQDPDRILRLSREDVEAVSRDTLALLDLKTEADRALVARLHRDYPAMADPSSGWGARYATDLHMTNDARLFRSAAWMKERGFGRFRAVRTADGAAVQQFSAPDGALRSWYPAALPAGGDFWVAASADYYRERKYLSCEDPDGKATAFLHPDDDRKVDGKRFSRAHFRVLPGRVYTALYEGRMVHNFDHAQKAYSGGEGRQAEWHPIATGEKFLGPRMFVCPEEAKVPAPERIGFCDITGATNERTMLACLLPPGCAAGNKVPILAPEPGRWFALAAIANSFVFDWMLRFRVSTTLNWQYLRIMPVPLPNRIDSPLLRQDVARLSCTTPEMASYWNEVFPDRPWTYACAAIGPRERADLRAAIDARVALAYGVTGPEYARILTGFPLLDRGQPALPGDVFLTEGNPDAFAQSMPEDRARRWIVVNDVPFEASPRSFITRDLALLTFLRLSGEGLPDRPLDAWYRDVVGLDPEGSLSRFRIGSVRDLEARVERAHALGAVAYVPGGASGAATGDDEGAETAD